jgi:hypothetical protein
MLPEEGVRRLKQELEAGLPDSEVLYTFGDFYPMFYPNEQRPLGAFRPDQLNAVCEPPAGCAPPLAANARRDGGELVADIPLDPTVDAFLIQHRLRDKPLLPVVVGLEALAEAAKLFGGQRAVEFRNVQMLDGLLFHTDRAVTAMVHATAESNGAIDCRLTCDFRNRNGGLIQKDRPYLRATVEIGAGQSNAANVVAAPPASWTDFTYPDDSAVYHGPAFRGVNGIACDRAGGWGRIAARPLSELVGPQRAAEWTIPSCVLDAALYACGIHLWMHGQGAISLPNSIGRLRLGRSPRDGETCLVRFVCREIANDAAGYEFTVVGEDGALIVAAEDYRKVILARGGVK